MKRKTIIIGIIVAVLIVVFIIVSRKKQQQAAIQASTPSIPISPVSPIVPSSIIRPLPGDPTRISAPVVTRDNSLVINNDPVTGRRGRV